MACTNKELKKNKDFYDGYVKEEHYNYQSLQTLAANYDILTATISTANAKTKTEIIGPDGKPMTISELLAIRNNSTVDKIAKAMNDSYLATRFEVTKIVTDETYIVLDPFEKERKELADKAEKNKCEIDAAIQKANNKKKVSYFIKCRSLF